MADADLTPLQASCVNPQIWQYPFPIYKHLREDRPAHVDPRSGNFVLTRYEDASEVVLNTELYSNRTGLIQMRDRPTAAITQKIFAENGWLPRE